MTLEITLKQTLDQSIVEGSFTEFVNDLNIAAAAGKQYVLADELIGGAVRQVAFETRSITRIRELEDEHAFIGR